MATSPQYGAPRASLPDPGGAPVETAPEISGTFPSLGALADAGGGSRPTGLIAIMLGTAAVAGVWAFARR